MRTLTLAAAVVVALIVLFSAVALAVVATLADRFPRPDPTGASAAGRPYHESFDPADGGGW